MNIASIYSRNRILILGMLSIILVSCGGSKSQDSGVTIPLDVSYLVGTLSDTLDSKFGSPQFSNLSYTPDPMAEGVKLRAYRLAIVGDTRIEHVRGDSVVALENIPYRTLQYYPDHSGTVLVVFLVPYDSYVYIQKVDPVNGRDLPIPDLHDTQSWLVIEAFTHGKDDVN